MRQELHGSGWVNDSVRIIECSGLITRNEGLASFIRKNFKSVIEAKRGNPFIIDECDVDSLDSGDEFIEDDPGVFGDVGGYLDGVIKQGKNSKNQEVFKVKRKEFLNSLRTKNSLIDWSVLEILSDKTDKSLYFSMDCFL